MPTFQAAEQTTHRYNDRMPKTEMFTEAFATLRNILQRHGRQLKVVVDKPGDFQLASPTKVDRIGRPLFVAAVQIKKNYVSFHLMGVYGDPGLLKKMSPTLRKWMQGKTCFNFTTIDPAHVNELGALTKKGIERFKKIKLPWS
jgi:hypothetical protein